MEYLFYYFKSKDSIMKNLNFFKTTLILLLLSLNAFAGGNGLGIKGGLNYAGFSGNGFGKGKMLLGYHAGLFIRLTLSEHFAFQPELLYSVKGSELTFNQLYVYGTGKFKLTYFDLPLILVYSPIEKFNVHGGMYFSSLSKVKIQNVTSSGSDFDFSANLNMDDFNRIDYGILVGAGIDLVHLSFGIRYNYGVVPVGKKYDFSGNIKRFPDAQNAVVQVYVGLRIL